MKLSKDVQMLTSRRGSMKAVDGAIINVLVDDANGVNWQFKYRKHARSAYKWEFLGGGDLLSFSNAVITPTPINTWVNGAGNIVLPFSGLFLPRVEMHVTTTASAFPIVGVMKNGTTTPYDTWTMLLVANETKWFSAEQQPREMLAASSVNIAMNTPALGPGSSFQYLKIRPAAVAI